MIFLLLAFAPHGGTVSATKAVSTIKEETTMISKIALATLTLAIALNGSAAFAGGKKETADPRSNMVGLAKKSKSPWQTWCDIDPNCNGWAQAEKLSQQGKLKF
jgi:hypothetical protein